MYLMPSKGSRVFLYFKNGDESSAMAVNCIRQEGDGAENEYRKRSLRAENQKERKLYPDRMGVAEYEAISARKNGTATQEQIELFG